MYYNVSLLVILLLFSNILVGQDIAQWRGPARNGIYPDEDLLDRWPERGPELLWSMKGIGSGFSSVSMQGGIIYATGKKDSIEYLSAIESANGDLLWQIPYGLSPRRSFKETRCTPTVEGDNIFLISGRGEVVCVDVPRQHIKWHVDAYRKFKGLYANWEVVESPLLVDRGYKQIIANVLRNYLLGVNAENGEILGSCAPQWLYIRVNMDQ